MKIELDPREDKYQNIYHVGRIQSPVLLRFKKGIVFFVFTSEEGAEEIHVGCAKSGSECSSVKKRLAEDGSVDRYVIELKKREDADQKTYYIGVVQDDSIELPLEDGYVFFVFTSKNGGEELHITKNKEQSVREMSSVNPEVIRVERRPESGLFRASRRSGQFA